MTIRNFRASDFKEGNDAVKVARSTRDRISAPVATSTPIIAPNADPEAVPSGSVPEVLTWVGDDKERAQKALDVELADAKPRKGLVSQLSDLVAVEPEPEPEVETEEPESVEEPDADSNVDDVPDADVS